MTLVRELDMNEQIVKTKKGKEFHSLANIGNAYGGSQVGTDHEGNRIMAKVSVYKKPATDDNVSGNTAFKIG